MTLPQERALTQMGNELLRQAAIYRGIPIGRSGEALRRLRPTPALQRRMAEARDDAYRARHNGIGIISSVMRQTAPIITGRLRYSMRVFTKPRTIEVSFNTPYAARVNETSKYNNHYVERGALKAQTRANRQFPQQPVKFRWKRRVYMNKRGKVETRFAIQSVAGRRRR